MTSLYELGLVLLILYVPPISTLDLQQKLFFFGNMNIALFAIVEGGSTYLQWHQSRRRDRIEDARNELAVAYGPLYSIIMDHHNLPPMLDDAYYWAFSFDEKDEIDRIFSTMPYMFSEDLYSLWKKEVQNLEGDISLIS